MQGAQPLPPARDLDADGRDVAEWSIAHVGAWLADVGLAALQAPFAQHRIAGDVLLDLNIDVVAAMLRLPGAQKSVLKRERDRLRTCA